MKKLKTKIMLKYAKCGKCKTGKYTYELDRHEPLCPYIGCYKRRRCSFYVPLNEQKPSFVKRLLNRLSVTPPPEK